MIKGVLPNSITIMNKNNFHKGKILSQLSLIRLLKPIQMKKLKNQMRPKNKTQRHMSSYPEIKSTTHYYSSYINTLHYF